MKGMMSLNKYSFYSKPPKWGHSYIVQSVEYTDTSHDNTVLRVSPIPSLVMPNKWKEWLLPGITPAV